MTGCQQINTIQGCQFSRGVAPLNEHHHSQDSMGVIQCQVVPAALTLPPGTEKLFHSLTNQNIEV